MKVGDLVVRAYTWPSLVPGIIIDEKAETLEFDGTHEAPYSYETISFSVSWSDGTTSTETIHELEYLEDILPK